MLQGILPGIADKIIGTIFPDDADKAKKLEAKAKLLEAEQKGQFIELETRMQAIVMEAQSQHKFVALARPAFLYVMYLMILAAVPMGIVHAINPEAGQAFIVGFNGWLAALPAELWALFGAGYLGYVNKRSGDKALLLGKDHTPGLFSKLLG